jgi:hypothetical protein
VFHIQLCAALNLPNPLFQRRPGRWCGATTLVTAAAAGVCIAALLATTPTAALAAPGGGIVLAANDLPTVISNLKTWIMGLLAAIATLFLVLAGVYWATAGGDPAQVDKAKAAFRNALIGYGMAVLAPIFLQVLQGIVGPA